MRVAARRGLEDVSLRHVAAEAGVTAGMVQHYFRTKDEMMVFALGAVRERVERRLAEAPEPEGSRRRVEALLVQLLPLDEERTLEAHVSLAFQAYAAVKPEIAANLRADTARMRQGLAAWIGGDPRHATGLLALAEGLSMQVLGQHLTGEEALAVLRAHLDLVVGGDRRLGAAPNDGGRGRAT